MNSKFNVRFVSLALTFCAVSLTATAAITVEQCRAQCNQAEDLCILGAKELYRIALSQLNPNDPEYDLKKAVAGTQEASDKLDCIESAINCRRGCE